MQENCHGAPQLNRQQNESARSTGTKFSFVTDNISHDYLGQAYPKCQKCGFPLRLVSVHPHYGEHWECSRCGNVVINPYGTYAESLTDREVLNRPPNEAKLRGIR
jgi:hypothetical protein